MFPTFILFLGLASSEVRRRQASCPGILYEGRCYTPFERHVSYEEAGRACRALDSTLLTAATAAEKQVILASLEGTAWLGVSRTEDEVRRGMCPAFYPAGEQTAWFIPCTTLLSYVCKSEDVYPTLSPPTTPHHSSHGCQDSVTGLQQEILERHNLLRALHADTGPLCWNGDLETAAAQYAVELGNNGGIEHSTQARHGENLYTILYPTHSQLDPAWYYRHAVDKWYSEIRHYDWERPGFSTTYGHFTQVVWRDTYQVGCGHAFGLNIKGKKRMVVVCRYNPRGSRHQGGYRDNVGTLVAGK